MKVKGLSDRVVHPQLKIYLAMYSCIYKILLYSDQIQHMSKAGLNALIIYSEENEPIKELTCDGHHCFTPLHISASMISRKDGMLIKHLLSARMKLYVSYQFTPQENYFLGIDGQGKLAEVGLFVYPSMKFMAYEAKLW